MKNTTVYLLRHAETVPEEGLKNAEWTLSDEGVRQSNDLAFKLNKLGIDAIYSSPFKRAVSTVKPLAKELDLPISLEGGFKELNASLDYLAPLEWQELAKKMWDEFTFSNEGCESMRECQMRFMLALNKIAKEHPGQTILICTHGMPLGGVLKVFDNAYNYEDSTRMKMPDVFKLVSDGSEGRWDKSYIYE